MKTVELEHVARFTNGFAFKPTDWETAGLKIIRIQNLTNTEKPYNRTSKIVPERYIVRKGDILVSWSATLDVFEWEDQEDALLNQHIFKVELDSNLMDKGYFKYALRYSIEKMSQFTHGSTMKHIVRKDFLKHRIPLPPMEEQKRIVKILDYSDKVLQKRKKSLELVDEYIKSLFLDTFGDPINNPKGWQIDKLESVASRVTDGTHKTPKYVEKGVRFISAKNIKNGEIKWKDIKYVTEIEHEFITRRCKPEKGDILLTKSGSLGMAAIVDTDFEFSLFESLALIKLKKDIVDPIYLKEYLNLEQIKSIYSQMAKGVGVKHLHLINIKELPVLMPPKEIQIRFSQIVMSTKSLKQRMIDQTKEIEALEKSLMQSSFDESLLPS